jgi:plasmid stability protein
MATLTIRNVDGGVKERLRLHVARHGRSMEAEARTILSEAVAGDPDQAEPNLAEANWRFAPPGGADLELPPNESSTSRRRSTRDRRRHQCHLGADARRAGSGGATRVGTRRKDAHMIRFLHLVLRSGWPARPANLFIVTYRDARKASILSRKIGRLSFEVCF